MLHVESEPLHTLENEFLDMAARMPAQPARTLPLVCQRDVCRYHAPSASGLFPASGPPMVKQPYPLIGVSEFDALEQLCDQQHQQPGFSALEIHLEILEEERADLLDEGASDFLLANNQLQIARVLIALQRGEEAWPLARGLFDAFIAEGHFELAADTCAVLYEAGQAQSQIALGQGIWLAVTCPIDPELMADLLCHFADEVATDVSSAAVAAATALFLVDVRARGDEREELMVFATQLLGSVARKYDQVDSPQALDSWMESHGLKRPEVFLACLRQIVDALVGDDWWFDRHTVYERLPCP